MDNRLTLDPNNQLAYLEDTSELIVGTEYVVTGEMYLSPNTRFTYRGRSDIALTKRPHGVPARRTRVAADVAPAPAPADSVTLFTTTSYPYATKNRLDAAGLNASFIPVTGGSMTGNLTIGAALTTGYGVVGGDTSIEIGGARAGTPANSYIDFHSQAGTDFDFRILRAPGPNGDAYLLQSGTGQLRLSNPGRGFVDVTESLAVGGTIGARNSINTTGNNAGYVFEDRVVPGANWILYAYGGAARVWYGGDRAWWDSAGNFINTGMVYCYSYMMHIVGTQSVWGYLTRPDTPGYKNLAMATASGQWLDNFQVNSVTSIIMGNLYVSNGGGIQVAGGATFNSPISVNSGVSFINQLNVNYLGNFGNTQLNGTLTVNGYTTVGDFQSVGNCWVPNGFGYFGNYLSVGNDAVIGRNARIVGHLEVDGGTDHYNFFNVWGGGVNFHSTTGISADLYVSGLLSVYTISVNSTILINPSGNNNITGVNYSQAISLNVTSHADIADLKIYGGNLYPGDDNYNDCGFGGNAWKYVVSYNFANASDVTLKSDIVELPEALPLIDAIRPKRFRYLTDRENRTHWGFVAQDIQAAMAEAGYVFDGCRVGANGKLELAYNELVAVLWQAVRELAAKLVTPKEEVLDAKP